MNTEQLVSSFHSYCIRVELMRVVITIAKYKSSAATLGFAEITLYLE